MAEAQRIHTEATGTVLRLATTYDAKNNRLVLVGQDSDESVWYATLTLPTAAATAWSARTYVTTPGNVSLLRTGGLAVVPDNHWGAIVAIPASRGGISAVATFRIGDTTMQMLSGPSNYPYSRALGAACAPCSPMQLLFVCENMNDQYEAWWESVDVSQWPPAPNGWHDWGGADKQVPAFAFGPSYVFAFKVAQSGGDDVLSWCYAKQSTLSYGSWWGLGALPSGNAMGNPQTLSWHSALYTQPQAVAILCRDSQTGTIYYAYESGSDSTSFYAWKAVPKITSAYDPVCVPYLNATPVVVNQNGSLVYSMYWLKEDTFTSWESASSVTGVAGVFTATIVPVTEGGQTQNVLTTIVQSANEPGLWIYPVDMT